MKKPNIVEDKSFDFAVRVVKLYRYLCEEKRNMCCLSNYCEAAQVLVRMCVKRCMDKVSVILSAK